MAASEIRFERAKASARPSVRRFLGHPGFGPNSFQRQKFAQWIFLRGQRPAFPLAT
jgi:hypothetical protein